LTSLDNSQELKSLIFSFIRDSAGDKSPLTTIIQYVRPLQNALLISSSAESALKTKSAEVFNEMLGWYEIETSELPSLVAAERLYLPSLNREKYREVLSPDPHGLTGILEATSTWTKDAEPPSSMAGFIITLSNFIAQRQLDGATAEKIISEIQMRPVFLKHVAVRTATTERLATLLMRNLSSSRNTG
jgi:hypothetical protein